MQGMEFGGRFARTPSNEAEMRDTPQDTDGGGKVEEELWYLER